MQELSRFATIMNDVANDKQIIPDHFGRLAHCRFLSNRLPVPPATLIRLGTYWQHASEAAHA